MFNNTAGDARVPEYDLSKPNIVPWRDKNLFFSFRISSWQARILLNPCLVVAGRCLFASMSTDTLMPTISLGTSVTFKWVMVISLGSGSTAYSGVLCIWISTRYLSVRSLSWLFSNSKKTSAFCVRKWALGLTLNLLMWRIWWAPTNASKWQMGFNSAFKGLILHIEPWGKHLSVEHKSRWCKSGMTIWKVKLFLWMPWSKKSIAPCIGNLSTRWKWLASHLGLFKVKEKVSSNH